MLIVAITDDAPGTGIILILFFIHSLIKILPGSEIDGVPASEINDKILPSFKYSMILLSFCFSLNLWYEINFFLILKLFSNFNDRLVSSHNIRDDKDKTDNARIEISAKLPIGVETI